MLQRAQGCSILIPAVLNLYTALSPLLLEEGAVSLLEPERNTLPPTSHTALILST